ncbi:MAG: hypothetical protein H6636_07100 [Anaerolineales bacterium]|nr:hypothetical protein [Anaerolineales bacterium]
MYHYPLKFTFANVAASPKITVTDAGGKTIMIASKTLLSNKEEFKVTANGQPLYTILSQESRLTDIPSNWDVYAANGLKLGLVDDDFYAEDAANYVKNRTVATSLNILKAHYVHERALKMYWLKDLAGKKVGLIAPDKKSFSLQQLPLADFTRKMPFFFRFITPSYYIQIGDRRVMFLQKQRTFMTDTYSLEANGQFTAAEEQLLVPSLLLTVFYERQQLKALYAN